MSVLNQVGFRVFNTVENISAAPPGTPNMPGIMFEIDPNGAGGTTTNFSSLSWIRPPTPARTFGRGTSTPPLRADGASPVRVQLAPDGGELRPGRPRCSFAEVQTFLATGTGANIFTAAVGKGTGRFVFSGAVDRLRINDIVYDFEPFGTVERAP